MKKLLFLSIICLTVLAIASCDKDSTETSSTDGTDIIQEGYVDLGLPSGTKWKATNETNPNDENNLYRYNEAKEKYGSGLPTKQQLEELKDNCQWIWNDTRKGCKVVGPNGKSIFLPLAEYDYHYCDGNTEISWEGFTWLWSSTPVDSDSVYIWYLYFNSDRVNIAYWDALSLLAVRLVQN